MAKTSESALKAIEKYNANLDEIKFRVPKGQKQAVKEAAEARGYKGIQPYIIALIEADAGLQLTKAKEDEKTPG